MAVIARKVMGTYYCRCTTCGAEWISEDPKGGPKGEGHKH